MEHCTKFLTNEFMLMVKSFVQVFQYPYFLSYESLAWLRISFFHDSVHEQVVDMHVVFMLYLSIYISLSPCSCVQRNSYPRKTTWSVQVNNLPHHTSPGHLISPSYQSCQMPFPNLWKQQTGSYSSTGTFQLILHKCSTLPC